MPRTAVFEAGWPKMSLAWVDQEIGKAMRLILFSSVGFL
jgi:hypothetical protein